MKQEDIDAMDAENEDKAAEEEWAALQDEEVEKTVVSEDGSVG